MRSVAQTSEHTCFIGPDTNWPDRYVPQRLTAITSNRYLVPPSEDVALVKKPRQVPEKSHTIEGFSELSQNQSVNSPLQKARFYGTRFFKDLFERNSATTEFSAGQTEGGFFPCFKNIAL
jgi:hypothetical protein